MWAKLSGSGLFTRALRGSAVLLLGFGVSNLLRLGSNLLLTRLLFPEAFGLMALVQMVLSGLVLFSDVGIATAILSHKRADEPEFLNTAWTLQVLRGFVLWGGAAVVAWPLAQLYGAPELAQMLPVAGLTLAIAGLTPTRLDTVVRHLAVGRLTLLDLVTQALSIVAMVGLAYVTQSVWSLIWGGVFGALVRLALAHLLIKGPPNRFAWHPWAVQEILRFGGWILLSTLCAFAVLQGDKAVLGRSLTLEELGIYNIGFFLASFPTLLQGAVQGRVFIPLYREVAADPTALNQKRLRRVRWLFTGVLLAFLAFLAVVGVPLVGLMYDARYALAGGVVVMLVCAQGPALIMAGYDQAALAGGDSRRLFFVQAARATLLIGFLIIGVAWGGVLGALLGQGLAGLIAMPLGGWLARRHGVQDLAHDLIYLAVAIGIAGLAVWLWPDALWALRTMGQPLP